MKPGLLGLRPSDVQCVRPTYCARGAAPAPAEAGNDPEAGHRGDPARGWVGASRVRQYGHLPGVAGEQQRTGAGIVQPRECGWCGGGGCPCM